MECWKGTHIIWAAGFALPMVAICFGIPLVGIVWILINWKWLDSAGFKRYFIVIYQGLKLNWAFWEFVNIIWKMIVIVINVFVPWEYPTLKLGAGFVFLIIFLWLTIFMKPYKNNLHLKLEIRELFCSITTLYTAVYFNQDT